tara:strand:- start:550 stop:1281 length:732 start_codon:yes stop_codon:yes gene_type:complete
MAMSKGMKIGLSVAAVGITGTIVFMLIKKMKKKKEEELGITPPTPVVTTPIVTTPVVTTPVITTPPTSSSGNTPFTNRTEGNAFRGWINDTYPTYAAEIDLDRTGQYNNSYIKKAWTAYGTIYLAQQQGTTTPVSTTPKATNGSNIAPFNVAGEAQKLHASMDGFQYSNDEFWDVTDPLSLSEREQVKTYFNAYLGEGNNLCNWIEGDFSFDDERRALAAWGYPNDAGYTSSNCNPPTPWYMQ